MIDTSFENQLLNFFFLVCVALLFPCNSLYDVTYHQVTWALQIYLFWLWFQREPTCFYSPSRRIDRLFRVILDVIQMYFLYPNNDVAFKITI
jgi:hypothetical protein